LREDLIHPQVSGNKFRKLKYNLLEARKQNFDTLLTFGGAYSNHIAAVAAAGRLMNFKTIGVIRGDELATKIEENPTLSFAKQCGMDFLFVSRSDYRTKNTEIFQEMLRSHFGEFYLIPEGGTNHLAVKGCEEILYEACKPFDMIAVSVGTGGTIAGVINSSFHSQKVLGFPALKGGFLYEDICKFADASKTNWTLMADYHFGGYADFDESLIAFINSFKLQTTIALDPIYTGKMMFGLTDLIQQKKIIRGTRVLAIHTGGLQGIAGFNQRLIKNKMTTIQ
jgi:1-aminocyclopropane-1-carboxylate deaminase